MLSYRLHFDQRIGTLRFGAGWSELGLAKAYLLSLVQGFQRIFWFEARGPAYGQGTDHGIIRGDWTPRPAYDALKTTTAVLGPEPKCLGWLDLGQGGYGFLFSGKDAPVFTAWSPPGKQCQTKFDVEVGVTDLAGKESSLPILEEVTGFDASRLISTHPHHGDTPVARHDGPLRKLVHLPPVNGVIVPGQRRLGVGESRTERT